MKFDAIQTPRGLAGRLAGLIPEESAARIADYAVGDGRLLEAAAERFPGSTFLGVDLDSRAIRRLRKKRPTWSLVRADFLALDNAAVSKCLGGLPTAVLLNPPFSGRGATLVGAKLLPEAVSGSRAGVFLASACSALEEGGVVGAVIPEMVLFGEKDARIREWLRPRFSWEVMERGDGHFREARVRIIVVRLVASKEAVSIPAVARDQKGLLSGLRVGIKRGGLSVVRAMNLQCRGGVEYVHTTGQRFSGRDPSLRLRGGKTVTGPGLLLPRVGVPREYHLQLLRKSETVVLSDCMYLLQTRTLAEAARLRGSLLSGLECLQARYLGTAARFMTIRRLEEILSELGVEPVSADGFEAANHRSGGCGSDVRLRIAEEQEQSSTCDVS